MATEVYNAGVQAVPLGLDPTQQHPEEEELPPSFFCRGLFDYQPDNDSSLSFRRGDIIEVFTRLESGWWDGLLGRERGWFPSNYVIVISDEEAFAAFAAAEAMAAAHLEFQNPQAAVDHTHNLALAHPQNVASQEWDHPHATAHNTLQSLSHSLSHSQNTQLHATNATYPQQNGTDAGPSMQADGPYPKSGTQSSDFWVPQVSADGRVSTTFLCSNSAFSAFPPLKRPISFTTYPHIPPSTYLVMGAYYPVPWRHFRSTM